jgi:hypothetical protein
MEPEVPQEALPAIAPVRTFGAVLGERGGSRSTARPDCCK